MQGYTTQFFKHTSLATNATDRLVLY